MPNEAHLNQALTLLRDVEDLVAKKANFGKRLDLTVLVVSVVTSGSLWLLLGDILPKPTLWLGAIGSTLTTGITIYIGTNNLNRVRDRSLKLLNKVSILVAHVRSRDVEDGLFWDTYKRLEFQLSEIKHGRNDSDQNEVAGMLGI